MANRPQDQQRSRRPDNPQPAKKKDQLDANEQSGSTGRNPGTGDEKQDGKDSGQDRYGMTGGADAGSGRADRDEADATPQTQSQSRFQKQRVAVSPAGKPSKQRRR